MIYLKYTDETCMYKDKYDACYVDTLLMNP